MKVAELMQPDVRTIDPDASIADVVVSLADAHISALPVVDHAGRMLGVVSHTDVIAVEAEAEERERSELLRDTAVRDIMTPRTLTISPEEDVREAARQMLYAEVHRLFVASGGDLVGVISTTDIVRAVATGKI
ncbi:MAG TPA: CBS domain-containing protein [Gemmatimonadales bacterium]|jgi:CBS domain-containing protein|nr:CBS domain-containing protein [Gemmatimonadales bacterium]